MAKYAIIQLGGRQFKITVGDKFILDRLDQEEGQKFEI
ncbi:bL21 family ribosomal protein, partial [Patescibacteria group bacterium]|nr:bL21 family ribosomal protein [Patescibacteria group bacterium]